MKNQPRKSTKSAKNTGWDFAPLRVFAAKPLCLIRVPGRNDSEITEANKENEEEYS